MCGSMCRIWCPWQPVRKTGTSSLSGPLVHGNGGIDRIGLGRRIFLGHGQKVGDVAGLLGAAAGEAIPTRLNSVAHFALDFGYGASLVQKPVKFDDTHLVEFGLLFEKYHPIVNCRH